MDQKIEGPQWPNEMGRESIMRRIAQVRADAELDKNTILHWNRQHPDSPPFDTAFEDSVIDWCDGRGPLPVLPESDSHAR